MPFNDRSYEPQGFETLTVDNTAGGVGFTAAKLSPNRGRAVLGPLETAQIRFTVDGTAPTTTVGHVLEIGQVLYLDEQKELVNFRAIRTGASSGSLPVTYYR